MAFSDDLCVPGIDLDIVQCLYHCMMTLSILTKSGADLVCLRSDVRQLQHDSDVISIY